MGREGSSTPFYPKSQLSTWLSLLILGTIIPARIPCQGCLPTTCTGALERRRLVQHHSVQSLIRGSVRAFPSHTHIQQQYTHSGTVAQGWGEWFMGFAVLGDSPCSISAHSCVITTEIASLNRVPRGEQGWIRPVLPPPPTPFVPTLHLPADPFPSRSGWCNTKSPAWASGNLVSSSNPVFAV